ncbi:RNF213 [Mytilus edulis]|uniref:RNF213 n=1 Tax=Mytilus edulis TaxID=6550 RepID=A0A8S3SFM0_MYTED|nr:RNF213 [Mytilus edulis]
MTHQEFRKETSSPNARTISWEKEMVSPSKTSSQPKTMSVERSFAVCGCKEGVANLIVCPQSEMYNTVLSLYSTEDDSLLPQSDEVLLCTPDTTLDLVYLLDYEVSDKGEKLLEKHMKSAQNRDIQFKLVVVCSRENEYKSRMVAALDKYRDHKCPLVEKNMSRLICLKDLLSSVRVVKSWRAGVGKSLFKMNMVTALMEKQVNVDGENCFVVSIPLYDRALVVDEVLEVLLEHTNPPHVREPRIFHFDISHEVQDGVDAFLFQLLVLGCLSHTSGNVWRRSDMDYYIIESMPLLARDSETQVGKLKCMHRCLDILPDVLCRSPKESLDIFDENFPDDGDEALTDINHEEPEGDREDCLQILLRHCGVKDPSWSELYHFVSFLNRQLQDFETSAFCSPIVLQDLPGFPAFVLKFLIQMSRDFATRSLQISEESPIDMLKRQLLDDEEEEEDIEELYEMRRKWESRHQQETSLMIKPEKVWKIILWIPTLDQRQRTLYNGLNSQPGVNLSENFDKLSRGEKIEKLCQVMGIEFPHDPDETYELTTDNVKKILAIYMRFRCDIPVIIMGETGCGKTRLIKFMCALQHLPDEPVENMIIMKIHERLKIIAVVTHIESRVPMRRLVYRVQPLPQSMLPLVWDFGQLNARVEEMYIKQMVLRYDECSFVSLRDVERVLEVMTWFYRQTEEEGILFDEDADHDEDYEKIEITRALILALGVCYQACLQKRQDFRDMIADYFEEPYQLLDIDQLETELIRCQDKFLDSVKLADNIARNQALKENVFMMIVCIELRIPLFLVGKPGSSKSLAKTIVADAMQGDTARSQLFKKYKQVQMVSFQCSPLSTPDGILGTFRQCAQFQRKKDLDRFVSVVVLDEIGLAEDSPRMPLKTLHPLLEDGCSGDDDLEEPELKQTGEMQEDEEPEDPVYKKVTNNSENVNKKRFGEGYLYKEEVPDEGELINSARGICRTSKDKERILKLIDNLIPSLSKAYSELFSELEKTKQREFFGLRDFYRSEHKPTWLQLKHAIMRNFGGLENINSVEIFKQCLMDTTVVMNDRRQEGDPDCSSGGMIKACLEGDSTLTGETRYLLLLTENYGDLAILQQKVLMMHNAQVCRNINRIKVCMETGSTVILLNLENLYESLYDALNQYYVHYGGQRYVDLGLGSHRVKCKVHEEFRLIVVAEKEIVYKKFPIPLINRLEKHVLSLSTMLSEVQLELANKLED